MFYEAVLLESEINILKDLLGRPLDIALPIVWQAELRTPEKSIFVIPEEVWTPDEDHPYGDVDRVSVVSDGHLTDLRADQSAKQFGIVRDINVISTLVSFSPKENVPEQELINGVILPAGTAYGEIYYHPLQLEKAKAQIAEKNALIWLDVALELVTELNPSVVLYTRGHFIKESLDGFPGDEGWAEFSYYIRRSLGSNQRLQSHPLV